MAVAVSAIGDVSKPMHDAATVTVSASPTATSGVGGTLYLVLTQVVSRGFTFLGNQFLLRYLSPSLLGLAIQLELLSVTILYFARESFRVALQRQPAGEGTLKNFRFISQVVVNLAYLIILVGLCACVSLGYGYLRKASHEVLNSAHFWPSFQLYAVATFIELLAEPCFAIIQQHALYKARARAETSAAMARCVAACMTAAVMYRRHDVASVLPFAIGQLCYAGTLFATYFSSVVPVTKTGNFSLLPKKIADESKKKKSSKYLLDFFSKSLLSLTATFYVQSLFKLLLTQGDSLIVSFLTDLRSQGAFALASNYGGLLSRLVFQPVEESSRNVFGRLLASANSSPSDKPSVSNSVLDSSTRISQTNTETNDSIATSSDSASNSTLHNQPSHDALSHLSTTLHIYTLSTLPLLALVPPLLPPLTTIALSPQWRTDETISLLHAYIHYLPFLALNGVLDAFVTSVATPAQIRVQSLLMACVTVAYGAVAWIFMGTSSQADTLRRFVGLGPALGSPGLVYANIVNMALRIAYSMWFIWRWVKLRPGGGDAVATSLFRRSVPSLSCVVTAGAVAAGFRYAIRQTSETHTPKTFAGVDGLCIEDLGYVLGGAVVLGTSILISEHQFLLDIMIPLVPERLAVKIKHYLPNPSVKRE